MQGSHPQHGFSLLEVMVAALIFSLGIVGAASLLIVASRSNHSAFLSTQASFLAHSLVDRMRINPVAVWRSGYDGSFPIKGTRRCDLTHACGPMDLAEHDRQIWSRQLAALLPDAKAELSCDRSAVGRDPVASGDVGKRPPYGGSCALEIIWSSRAIVAEASDAAEQRFHWVFQP